MDEGIYTRDQSRSQRRLEESTDKSKPHADKLKNETTQACAMREKLRTGKVDTAESAAEIKKAAKLKKQGRKAARKNAAVSGEIRHQLNEANEDQNAGGDAINAGGSLAEHGIYSVKKRAGKSADANGYGSKLHGAKHGATGAESTIVSGGEKATRHEAQKNLMKKEIQKQAFKEQARENANAFGSITKRFADKAEDMAGRIAEAVREFAEEHPLGLIIAGCVLILVLLLSGALSSCSIMAGGGNNVVIATSFTAQDSDIIAVENDYKVLEAGLQTEIDNIERDNPGYDEYNYSLCEISHNPYELAALLTVLYEDYTESEVQAMLTTIYNAQYTLTKERVVEIRTRTETRWHWVTHYRDEQRTGYRFENGHLVSYTYTVSVPYQVYESYEVEVEYEYYILNTTLTNNGIGAAVNSLGLTEDQLWRYGILVETQGNKPDIFGDNPYAVPDVNPEYEDYAVPGEYLTDQQFSNMLNEAKKYLGYPYVWGGSSPSTSFDCSGFVSYVINNCGNGWNYGRLTANGLKNATARVNASDVKAGDLIFFQGTYDTTGASHVGIVVDPVNKIMIHCGNPIQYASYDSNYWRQHFYCYGRIQ